MEFWYLVLSELVLLQSGRYHFYLEVTSQTYDLVGLTGSDLGRFCSYVQFYLQGCLMSHG